MNLDLLIKLVKLANNNPNENEANLAARKVCKIIAEGDYKFNGNPIKNPKVETRPQDYYRPTKEQNDYYNSNSSSSPFTDWFKKYYEQKQHGNARPPYNSYEEQYEYSVRREEERQRRRNQQNVYESPYESNVYDIPNKKSKIRRVCTKCGLDVETINIKEIFICSMCQWKDYL